MPLRIALENSPRLQRPALLRLQGGQRRTKAVITELGGASGLAGGGRRSAYSCQEALVASFASSRTKNHLVKKTPAWTHIVPKPARP
jgi:hypothetical protein